MHTGTGTCCLSRCGTAADAKIVGVTEAAVQRRGQARRASPPFHKIVGSCMLGTGAAGACPGVGPRRIQRSLAQLKPRSNDGDRPAGPVPPFPKPPADAYGDWHLLPVPVWDRGGCKDRWRD